MQLHAHILLIIHLRSVTLSTPANTCSLVAMCHLNHVTHAHTHSLVAMRHLNHILLFQTDKLALLKTH
jgi:hypothetical protein